MRCHRCGDEMTLYRRGDDYCPLCKRDMAVRNRQPQRRWTPQWRERAKAKDLTGSAA